MGKRFKILIVDDDPLNVEIVAFALKDEYEIMTALSGLDAISLLNKEAPDLIILDVMMPDISGFDVCKIIKSNKKHADIPVVFLTASGSKEVEFKGFEVGGIDYITKPIHSNLLKLRVSNHIAFKAQRDILTQQKNELTKALMELKIKNEQLQESEEQHRTILHTTMDGYWLVDIQGRLLEVNEVYCRMSGYRPEELHAMTIQDVDVMETADDTAARIKSIMTHGMGRFETRHRRKDGSIYDVEISVQSRPSDEGKMVVCLRDITEQKYAEEIVLRAKQDWEQTFDAIPELISIIDANHTIVRVNMAMADHCGFGLTPEDLVGRKCYELTHGTSCALDKCPHTMLMQDGFGHSVLVEEKHLNRVFDVTVSPLYSKDGQLEASVHIARDITERKRSEEERQKLEMQFQQTQKLESLGVLAGGIAHDFNNILTIILGHCYIIDKDIDDKADRKTHIKRIEKAANRAAELCRQMLTYAGKNSTIQTRINLWLMVDENVKMLTSAIKKNVEIELDLKNNVSEISGDSAQIQQVIMNVIINAAEAIGDENGTIKVSLAMAAISEGQLAKDFFGDHIMPGTYVCFAVSDNGCGMAPEAQKRIFEPFFTTKFTGRGLGMSAVLGIIKSHEGALQLSSILGVGTTFKIYFPPTGQIKAFEETQTVGLTSLSKDRGTILLVDDEESLRLVGSVLLNAMNFSTITASNGREALEIFRSHQNEIDLVVLDLLMPEMGGFEAYRRLRELSPAMPVVFCSGCSADEVMEGLENDKYIAVIKKPYNPDQLRNTLINLIGSRTD